MHAAMAAFAPPCRGLKDVRERGLRPAIGFSHPREVLRDPHLDPEARRAILSSWASDASAVENWPTLRWLYGTPAPVPYVEVMEALAALDRKADPSRPAGGTTAERSGRASVRSPPRGRDDRAGVRAGKCVCSPLRGTGDREAYAA